jgi:hypothetical protein
MKQSPFSPDAPVTNSLLALSLVVSISLACGVLHKPGRDYSSKPFDSQQWREGDAQTRGTMYFDLFAKRRLNGKTREQVVELLGEPDKQTSAESREVWLYRIEIRGETLLRYFPVSFNAAGTAFGGRIQNGTMSMVVDE